MKAKILAILLFIFFLLVESSFAQTFYSRKTGDWTDITAGDGTWSTFGHDGASCNCVPHSTANVIIASSHTVTVIDAGDINANNSITVQGTLTLNAGNSNNIATLITSSNSTINILAGDFKLTTPTSTTINGTINRQNTGTFPDGLIFEGSSVYNHAIDGGTIPAATWGIGSTCLVTGVTNTMPTGWAGQTFGNLVWDCVNQNNLFAFNANFTIAGNFEVKKTGTSSTSGLAVASTGNHTVTCGSFRMSENQASFYPYAASGTPQIGTLEVLGDLSISNGGTGVSGGSGRSVFKMAGSSNSSFNYNPSSFTLIGFAEFEIQVAKTPSTQVSFNGSLIFEPTGVGTPASIFNIVSGVAIIPNNTTISVGTIEGTGTLTMQDNSSLYLKRHRDSFNNTFSGRLNANSGSTVLYDSGSSGNDMLIFAPSVGSYYNIRLQGITGLKTLAGNIVLQGNLQNNSGATNFNGDTYSVSFQGSNPQSITGSAPTTFYTLIINNASNVSLNQNTTVTNALTLTNGRLILHTNNLTYSGVAANLTRTNGWVETNDIGVFIRGGLTSNFTFPVGSESHYQPITLSYAALDASVRFGNPSTPVPNSGVGSWFVDNHSVESDILIDNPQGGTLTWGTSRIGIYNTSWTPQAGTIYLSTNVYELNNVNFSFPIEFSVFSPSSTDFYTLADVAIWDVNSDLWSNDGTNPCYCSPNGVANANVRVRHNVSIPSSAVVASGTQIDIQQPVTLTTDQAFIAESLSGEEGARLVVSFNGLPVITNNSFANTQGTIVEFAGGAGTIPNQFSGANYRNLVISGTGNKIIGESTTIQENLTILSGTLESGSYDLIVTDSTTIAAGATFLDATTGGLNQFGGTLTNNGSFLGGGVGNESTFSFLGDITNGGIFNIDCNCEYNFNKNTPDLLITPNSTMIFGSSGSGSGNFSSDVIIRDGDGSVIFNTGDLGLSIKDSVIVTNDNKTGVQINGNGSLNGVTANSTWLQKPDAVLAYACEQEPMSIGILNASNGSNIVRYNRVGDQNIKATIYGNLEIIGGSNSSLQGNITVNGNLIISIGSILNAGSNNINIRGNWVGNGTFDAGTGSVIFDGTTHQTITTNSSAFNNININNSAHVQINNDLESNSITFTNGRLQLGDSDLFLTADTATNQITQTFSNASTSYVETNGTGGLVRNNLQTGIEYVFPIGNATSIRHLSITPNGGTFAEAIFGTLSPPAPTGSTDIAAGSWQLSGGNGVIKFFNTGCNTNNARVHKLNAGNWVQTGITTTAATPIYTTNTQDFSSFFGEFYTLFVPANITVQPTNPTLPSTEVGNNYSFTFSATGGTSSYTFSVSTGTLPAGLSLNPSTPSTGVLSGIPTQAGVFNFTITATDLTANTGSQNYTLLVSRANQNIVVSSLTYVALGNDKFDVSVLTSKGLPAKLFSTNTNVARIENDTLLVLQKNFGDADIMAFHPGDANYLPSDTVIVMRVKNFELVTTLNTDLESKIKLFPNPTTDNIWVELADFNFTFEKLEIYNSLGQKQNVLWHNSNNQTEIKTNVLNKGVYIIHLHTSKGSFIRRFSKL